MVAGGFDGQMIPVQTNAVVSGEQVDRKVQLRRFATLIQTRLLSKYRVMNEKVVTNKGVYRNLRFGGSLIDQG
jgi:hypothetical protein